MDDISVLICDDSALMRNLIGRIIDGTEGMRVVAKASNGQVALEKIKETNPDIIVLDIEMPVMNGIEFLRVRKEQKIKVPVVVLSSVATKGAAVTMEALELGAADFITKPAGSVSADISEVADQLIDMLASYGSQYARRQGKVPYIPEFFQKQRKLLKAESFVANKKADDNAPVQKPKLDAAQILSFNTVEKKEPVVITPVREGGSIDVIAIGISTGGPNALRDVFKMIDPRLKQPILVVQHMPKGFTKAFAESLDKICPLAVKEAEDGEKILGATVYIAPGDNHITVVETGGERFIKLTHDPQRNGHRRNHDRHGPRRRRGACRDAKAGRLDFGPGRRVEHRLRNAPRWLGNGRRAKAGFAYENGRRNQFARSRAFDGLSRGSQAKKVLQFEGPFLIHFVDFWPAGAYSKAA